MGVGPWDHSAFRRRMIELLFNNNKEFKSNIQIVKKFLIFRKINSAYSSIGIQLVPMVMHGINANHSHIVGIV